LSRPIYGHLPLVLESDGSKLSKSKHAVPIDPSSAAAELTAALTYLSQAPPPDLAACSIKDVWKWAVAHWNPQALAGRTEVRLSAPGDNPADSAGKIVARREGVLR
jgi:glutamyl/glutaminyl-tRNA synthetase